MKLKCQQPNANCPPYHHEGRFIADNATICGLRPDMKRCARCIAFQSPRSPDFSDDLEQFAAITLIEKGPAYDPFHESRASFGTFIRPHICLRLMNEKKREVKYQGRMDFTSGPGEAFSRADDDFPQGVSAIETYPDSGAAHFTEVVADAAAREDFFDALPELVACLTPRERQVFEYLRTDVSPTAIAALLKLSKGRVSQLRKQVIEKLSEKCQKRGWRSESI